MIEVQEIGFKKFGTEFPEGGFFFWTRFENLVAKRWKINDRVVPILVAIRIE